MGAHDDDAGRLNGTVGGVLSGTAGVGAIGCGGPAALVACSLYVVGNGHGIGGAHLGSTTDADAGGFAGGGCNVGAPGTRGNGGGTPVGEV